MYFYCPVFKEKYLYVFLALRELSLYTETLHILTPMACIGKVQTKFTQEEICEQLY